MMYLEDEEIGDLITRELSWIREGGYLFARESCFGQSGKFLCSKAKFFRLKALRLRASGNFILL